MDLEILLEGNLEGNLELRRVSGRRRSPGTRGFLVEHAGVQSATNAVGWRHGERYGVGCAFAVWKVQVGSQVPRLITACPVQG